MVKPKSKTVKPTKMFTKKITTSRSKSSVLDRLNKLTEDEWYLLKPQKKEHDKYYSSVCMILDDDYSVYKLRERGRIIKTLKTKMSVDLVENNLYRLYGYHHIRSFKKADLEDALIEDKINIDVTRRFLSDYFDINIYIINEESGTGIIYRDISDTLSIVLIYHESMDTYSALLSNSGNHFIHPDVLAQIIKMYPHTKMEDKPKSPTKVKPKFKSVKISDVYKNDKFRLYSIGRYTIAELQELADTYDIPKYNIRELKSGEKRVKDKTKRELYTLISEKCGM